MENSTENTVDIDYINLQVELKIDLTEAEKELIDKIAVLTRPKFNKFVKTVGIARYFKKRYLENIRTDVIRNEIAKLFKFKSVNQTTYFFNSRRLKTQLELNKK